MAAPHPDDEVDFWSQLIDWWKSTHNDPVPERMNEALMQAKLKCEPGNTPIRSGMNDSISIH